MRPLAQRGIRNQQESLVAILTLFRLATTRRTTALAVLFAFVCQAIIPLGFMPAPFASGSPLQFCPDGVSEELMALLHAGHAPKRLDHSGQHPVHQLDQLDHLGHLGQNQSQGEHHGHHIAKTSAIEASVETIEAEWAPFCAFAFTGAGEELAHAIEPGTVLRPSVSTPYLVFEKHHLPPLLFLHPPVRAPPLRLS